MLVLRSPSEMYSEPCQTSKMLCLAEIVNVYKLLTYFSKRSILDLWQGPEYVSNCCKSILTFFLFFNKYLLQRWNFMERRCNGTILFTITLQFKQWILYFFMINNGEHLIYIHIFDIWNISLQVQAYHDKSFTKILYLKKTWLSHLFPMHPFLPLENIRNRNEKGCIGKKLVNLLLSNVHKYRSQ